MGRLPLRFFAPAVALILGTVGLLAQQPPQPPPSQQQQVADDMQHGVARISLMDGEVSVQRGDSGEWVAGVVNAPLLSDDRIATGPNSRAEVQFDAANLLRLGGNAQLKLTTLEYGRFQMEFAKGTLTYRVLRPTTANVEIDTPSVSVRPSKEGIYRISVNDAGETEVTVRAGDLEVFTPRGSQWVNAGQTMMARGSASDPEFQIVSAIPVDDWDRWNDARDHVFLSSTSAQYIDPGTSGIYGAEDLGNYGVWTEVPNYGYCWRPTVAAGWAPYRAGRWVWEDWYGWTWVSYDPWGWAPYHYGRWLWEANYGWMWNPGMIGMRHYWSPALVAFFGWGPGMGFGFGFGNIGWVPLAPFELFHPWWGRGFYGNAAYFNRGFGFTNVNISAAYRNARFNGVSGMSAEAFRGGQFGSISRVSGEQVRSAGLVRGAVPIAPSRANLNFSNRAAAFTPRGAANQHFFTHQQPSAAQRIPFAQQRGALEGATRAGGNAAPAAGGGRQLGGSAAGNTRPAESGAMARGGQAGAAPSSGAAGGGWRRFGEPGAQNSAPAAGRSEGNAMRGGQNPAMQNTRPSQAGGNGWQRFGEPGTSRQAAPSGGYSAPRYSAPSSSSPRYSSPSYSAPRYSAPSNSAPRYSAPAGRSAAPSYSAPRGGSSGGGGGGARSSGGGGHGSGGGHSRR
jgi:hypothetical protein